MEKDKDTEKELNEKESEQVSGGSWEIDPELLKPEFTPPSYKIVILEPEEPFSIAKDCQNFSDIKKSSCKLIDKGQLGQCKFCGRNY